MNYDLDMSPNTNIYYIRDCKFETGKYKLKTRNM